MLLPFMRELIVGPTPLHLINAPTPGSGKGLLSNITALIATGRPPRSFSWTTNSEEVRKTITSFLTANAIGVIGVDNIAGPLDSHVWAKVLTDQVWTERILGTNTVAGGGGGIPIRATWYGTGNNVPLSNETVRRVLHIRLVPDCENPEDRPEGSFQHPHLEGWVMQERGRLVHAALTLAPFAYRVREAGRLPKVPRAWGSYESYNTLMGGLMALLDMKGWRGNVDELRESSDTEMATWRALVPEWWRVHPAKEMTAAEVFAFAEQQSLLPEDLADETRSLKSRVTQFGQMLHRYSDRVIGGYRIGRRLIRGRTMYRVRVNSEATAGVAAAESAPLPF
jgi:hypothetical protein